MILIESERLYVRQFVMDDLEDTYRLNGDEEIMRYIRTPKNREENLAFLKETIAAYGIQPVTWRLALLTKDPDEFVGSFAIIPLAGTDELQIGYALLKEYWGKGYAAEILNAGLKYVFEVMGLASIAAVTEVENIASRKVLIKCGFTLEKQYEEKGKQLYLYRCFHS